MTVENYVETREPFEAKGFCFEVMCFGPKAYWLQVSSKAGPNVNVSNGKWETAGFKAFMPKSERELNKVADVLAEESRTHGVSFQLDDDRNQQDEDGTHLYYKIRKLRSRVLA